MKNSSVLEFVLFLLNVSHVTQIERIESLVIILNLLKGEVVSSLVVLLHTADSTSHLRSKREKMLTAWLLTKTSYTSTAAAC